MRNLKIRVNPSNKYWRHPDVVWTFLQCLKLDKSWECPLLAQTSYERGADFKNKRSRKNEWWLCLICGHSIFREPSKPLVRWPNLVCHYSDKKGEWVYVGFKGSLNLANTETQDGHNLISTRIKWNEAVEQVVLSQEWSSDFLHFREDAPALIKIQNSNTAMLELQWHGQQPTYFEFSLHGSSKAIGEIKSKCGK